MCGLMIIGWAALLSLVVFASLVLWFIIKHKDDFNDNDNWY